MPALRRLADAPQPLAPRLPLLWLCDRDAKDLSDLRFPVSGRLRGWDAEDSRRWREGCFRKPGFFGWILIRPQKRAVMRRSSSAFSKHQADILIGTQMIVKGHDFPDVTLVGILAADVSLYAPDYRSAERTFQLLVQASGRAGRAEKPGIAVIQTYMPDHYTIQTASRQDYGEFFRQEMRFRRLHALPACLPYVEHSDCREKRRNCLHGSWIRSLWRCRSILGIRRS